MKFKRSVKTLLCLLILIASLTSFGLSASAQPSGSPPLNPPLVRGGEIGGVICESISDAQEIVRRLKDYELLRELDKVKDQTIANLEKEIELLKRESELKDRIIQIKDMEIEATRRAVNDMKEISDRAIKLAEIGKPKTNWQMIGMAILSAIVLGIALGK